VRTRLRWLVADVSGSRQSAETFACVVPEIDVNYLVDLYVDRLRTFAASVGFGIESDLLAVP